MATIAIGGEVEPGRVVRSRPGWSRVRAEGPLLKPSCSAVEVYGLDMTAGCADKCAYCHIRGSDSFPGEGKVLFDPEVVDRLRGFLDRLDEPPRQVVLSPTSDPLPPLREIREATFKVVELLLDRKINVLLMTRGRVNQEMVDLLSDHVDRVRVAIGLTTLDRKLSRTLEPWACPLGSDCGLSGRW